MKTTSSDTSILFESINRKAGIVGADSIYVCLNPTRYNLAPFTHSATGAMEVNSSILCPKCTEKMSPSIYKIHDYFECIYCNGTWIQGEELIEHLRNAIIGISACEFREVAAAADKSRTKYQCPHCAGHSLEEIRVFETPIEYCPSCEGVFFDPEEINAVLPRFKVSDEESMHADFQAAAHWFRIFRALLSLIT